MGAPWQTVCIDTDIRRALIIGRTDINGIDYVNIDPANHARLTVVFLNPVAPKDPTDPGDTDDAYGLSTDLSKVALTGGTRIVGIQPTSASRNPDGSLTITVSESGDYSTYTLTLNVAALDRLFASIDFSFMAACPVDFDCCAATICPPRPPADLLIDYQAKDYASFRQLLLDLLPQLNPAYTESNPSDFGVALIELFAYAGDRLSYFQDAIANEAYLDTLRQRISARRHARLVDYRMHDGRNAWAAVHLAVDSSTTLPLGTRILSRIGPPLAGDTSPPTVIVAGGKITVQSMRADPALKPVAAFETAFAIRLEPVNNIIYPHTWGNEECCVARGTREVFLYATQPGGTIATVPILHQGDYLVIEEVKGPLTGAAADADPGHRQLVIIDSEPEPPTSDPLFSNQLLPGAVVRKRQAGDQPLPLLRVRWRVADQLRRPYCLSAKLANGTLTHNVSVLRGNIVLADHGLTVRETLTLTDPVPSSPPYRPRLTHGPLTMQIQPAAVRYDPSTGRLATPRTDLTGDARQARPAVSLFVTGRSATELWTAASDLLESTAFDTVFVPELDNELRAHLRFGDDGYGQSIVGATAIAATYRVGNGVTGNVGAEALAHVAPDGPFAGVTLVRNPLAARDGTEPEAIDDVRQWAPEAFRAVQYRAVTEADYARTAQLLPQVLSAVASFRWTGSWYTAFVAIQPSNPADLVNAANGVTRLSLALMLTVERFLESYRLAGYDLEIRPPQFLAIEIGLLVCAADDQFSSDVGQAVLAALGTGSLPDGGTGVFAPGQFVFGQPVYLSQIYAAVQGVEGVCSAVVTRFTPFGQSDNGELARGVIPVGPWQIARLDNDPNFMERGVLKITMRGGKL